MIGNAEHLDMRAARAAATPGAPDDMHRQQVVRICRQAFPHDPAGQRTGLALSVRAPRGAGAGRHTLPGRAVGQLETGRREPSAAIPASENGRSGTSTPRHGVTTSCPLPSADARVNAVTCRRFSNPSGTNADSTARPSSCVSLPNRPPGVWRRRRTRVAGPAATRANNSSPRCGSSRTCHTGSPVCRLRNARPSSTTRLGGPVERQHRADGRVADQDLHRFPVHRADP